jgi:hypothetical protein
MVNLLEVIVLIVKVPKVKFLEVIVPEVKFIEVIVPKGHSFVDSFSDTKEGIYDPKMFGTIPMKKRFSIDYFNQE